MPPSTKQHMSAKRPKKSPKSASAKKQMMKALKHDLHYASVHEAAHGVVAAAVGYSGTIYLAPPVFQFEGQKLVDGRFMMSKMSPRLAATVAWAGSIAECRLRGGSDLEEFEDEIECSPLSSSDERIVSAVDEQEQREAMIEAWRLVDANWDKIEKLAERCRADFLALDSACVEVQQAPTATKASSSHRRRAGAKEKTRK